MNWYAIAIETSTGDTETWELAPDEQTARQQAEKWIAANAPTAKLK